MLTVTEGSGCRSCKGVDLLFDHSFGRASEDIITSLRDDLLGRLVTIPDCRPAWRDRQARFQTPACFAQRLEAIDPNRYEQGAARGVAISSSQIGFVFLVDGELLDWGVSVNARRGREAAFDNTAAWIGHYQLDLLLVEDVAQSRKGRYPRVLRDAVLKAAAMANPTAIELPRSVM